MGAVCSQKEIKQAEGDVTHASLEAFKVISKREDSIIIEVTGDLEDEFIGNHRIISIFKAFSARNARKLSTTFKPNKKLVTDQIKECHEHGLLQACRLAWTHHTPLCLSPEHFWMLIMQGVACHLHFTDKRDLHEDFDEFDTGINLEVCIDDIDIKSPDDWRNSCHEVMEYIEDNLGKVFDAIKPEFSTIDRDQDIMFMLSLCHKHKYTEYYQAKGGRCGGISRIKLMGTVEDWENLRDACDELKTLGLDWWLEELDLILKNLVSSRRGEGKDTDVEFWHSMYRMQKSGRVYGWIFNFFPFEGGKKPRAREDFFDIRDLPVERSIPKFECECSEDVCECSRGSSELEDDESDVATITKVPLGLSRVNLSCEYEGDIVPYTFHAGFLGCELQSTFLVPAIGWGVGLKSGYGSASEKKKSKTRESKRKKQKKQKKKKKKKRRRSSVRLERSTVTRQKTRGGSRDRENQPGLLRVKSRDRDRHRDRDKHSDYSSEGRTPRGRAKRKDKSDGYDSTESDSESVRKTSRKYLDRGKKVMSATDVLDEDSSHSFRARDRKSKKKKKKRRRQIEGRRDSITEMSTSSKAGSLKGSVKNSKKRKKAVDTSSETMSRSKSRKGTKMKLYE